ncbi:hypothetical protein RIF29_41405 [Crotalaria pallida]|uniref:Wings apart-like protein C-terminal domain-containing protein n=1 Tax=Crotalaria pallida TaxID=3830 RepID=A0AAN9E6C0_CROPI
MATALEEYRNRNPKRAKNHNALSVPATLVMDEVYFALGGLRKEHPVGIIRASLLSLLSICSTPHHLHLLTSHGMTKTIIDAILGLTLNDSSSNLAAATLFYILTSDGQDVHLLESPGCVRFLIKLLRPFVSEASEDKELTFGFKLLALSKKNASIFRNTKERLDSCSDAIFCRVQEILVNCKELKPACQNGSGVVRPELCPKWLALLTMEKACLSAISLDETSRTVQKTGGNFKEKLRELGGLNAVFDISLNCLSDLECWMEDSSLPTKDLRSDEWLKSLTLLLKCLKIMENAAFLSKDNQTHLLELNGKLSHLATPFSFVELVINVLKILSDLCLSQNAAASSNDNKPGDPEITKGSHDSESDKFTDLQENETGSNNSTLMDYDMERASSVKSFNLSQKCQLLRRCTRLESSLSVSESPSTSMTYKHTNARVGSSSSRSCSGASRCSDDSHDPFAFDEVDIAPTKWDVLSGKREKSCSEKCEVTNREFEDGCRSHVDVKQQELSNGDINCLSSHISDEEGSSLLTDCLLTSVKVLINLTNDNPVGCQQVAAYGGLETMPLLLVGHFPSFRSSSKSGTAKNHQHDRHLTDHELDFLVAILGLLVNLVEKDGDNRSRLAGARVLLPTSEGLGQEVQMGVIQLLCSIFLANQDEGEEAVEDGHLLLNDEAAFLRGEKEAEKMIVEAYSALLLAFLSTESKSIRKAIADNFPDRNLSILVPVLDRFVEFHLALNMISPETHKAVSEVIESCRRIP